MNKSIDEQKFIKTIQETIGLLKSAMQKLGTLMDTMPDGKSQKKTAKKELKGSINKYLS